MESAWRPVLNTTAEIIPPGALMRVSADVEVTTGCLRVAKPTANGDTTVMVNSLVAIPSYDAVNLPACTGQGTFGPDPVIAFDAADGTPAVNEEWGSKAGSWLAGKAKQGFVILGGAGQGLVNSSRLTKSCCPPAASGSGSGSGGSGSGTPPPGSGSGGSGSGTSGSGGSGSGTSPPPPPPPACSGMTIVTGSACIGGISRVSTGTLNIVNGCLVVTGITTTSQGCCACSPPPGSGSGSSGSGGGGSTFVPCCVNPVPNTQYVQFGGALASLGTVAVYNNNGGLSWQAAIVGPAPCANNAVTGLTVSVVCSGTGNWGITVAYTANDGSSGQFNVGGVLSDSCSPLQITFNGTAISTTTPVSSCVGAASAVVTL